MLKTILLTTLLFSFSAHASCIGEAQIIGKIAEVKKSLTSCRAFLSNATSIQSSVVCPLDEGKLFSEGFEIGLVNGHDCRMEAGDEVSGILVDNGSFIYLE